MPPHQAQLGLFTTATGELHTGPGAVRCEICGGFASATVQLGERVACRRCVLAEFGAQAEPSMAPATEAEVIRWLRARGYTVRKARQVPSAPGSETSRQARAKVLPRAGTLRRRVYDALCEAGGLTAEELESYTNLGGNTIRPRLQELRHLGLVVDGKRRRRTVAGNLAVVWEVVLDD